MGTVHVEAATKAGSWTDHERVTFLLDAARGFGSTLDETRIYRSLHSLVSGVMPVDGLIVSSYDPEAQLIYCEHAWSDGVVLDTSGFPPVKWTASGGMQ